eukprot:TRINITY_DN5797_c0_g1_i1.p1 TRINITY_DN5797_c0_g1~~TRINITY_DN5797_c0_g1_i1.p1  ORF type:complete len:159 (-),score=27.82 TRINITY_DN5797_c0_g1_i1:29-505(-)
MQGSTGTLAFMAPELAVEESDEAVPMVRVHPFACDVFSFGFLLFECVTLEREPLSRRLSTAQEFNPRIAPTLTASEMKGVYGEVPPVLYTIVQQCWAQAPRDRPGMHWVVCELEGWLGAVDTIIEHYMYCLLYTSDAADDLLCGDLGGRRYIKKKKTM